MRILVTTAGGGNALNLVRSLRDAFGHNCTIVGVNADKYELAKSNADKNYLVPKFNSGEYLSTMERIIGFEEIYFMIPNHELEIQTIVNSGFDYIKSKCFLPSKETVNLCIDKYALIDKLKRNGIDNVPESVRLDNLREKLVEVEYPTWMRLTKGAGSQGAFLAHDAEESNFWVDYWMEHKGVEESDFMLSEYLPGADYHYFSLWKNGEMIIGKSIERLKYCCGKYTLTGTSSSPSVCKLVKKHTLDYLTEKIVKTVDSNANGLFGIDYKCDKNDEPCLTEINIGRFPRINYIFNLGSKPNIAELYVKCGLGRSVEKYDMRFVYPDDVYLIRDFDTAPVMKTLDEIEDYFS